jgi:hypothetical protein
MQIAATDPWLVAAVLVALIETLWGRAVILPDTRDIGDCEWVGTEPGLTVAGDEKNVSYTKY